MQSLCSLRLKRDGPTSLLDFFWPTDAGIKRFRNWTGNAWEIDVTGPRKKIKCIEVVTFHSDVLKYKIVTIPVHISTEKEHSRAAQPNQVATGHQRLFQGFRWSPVLGQLCQHECFHREDHTPGRPAAHWHIKLKIRKV